MNVHVTLMLEPGEDSDMDPEQLANDILIAAGGDIKTDTCTVYITAQKTGSVGGPAAAPPTS